MTARRSSRPRGSLPRDAGGTWSLTLTLLAIALLALVAMLVRSGAEEDRPRRVVVLLAYSALDDVLHDGLLPAFQRYWQETRNERVEFVTTYGGSRALAERILQKVPAHLAILTSEIDALRLVPRVVDAGAWRELPYGGVLGRTPLVFLVRAGNPVRAASFDDLLSSRLAAVRPDAATSGLGECMLLAAYGARWRATGDRRAALDLAAGLTGASPPPAATAREAAMRFRGGEGDVCVVYEHDVVGTPSRAGPEGDVVHPRPTLVCEPVVVVIRRNVPPTHQPLIRSFTDFLWSGQGRAILRAYGFHAPDATPAAMGLEEAFTLGDLGGAESVATHVLDVLRAGPAASD